MTPRFHLRRTRRSAGGFTDNQWAGVEPEDHYSNKELENKYLTNGYCLCYNCSIEITEVTPPRRK